jgi:hypothetical protein
MKFDNVKYLVFGPEGELIDDNKVTEKQDEHTITAEFGLGTLDITHSAFSGAEISVAGDCSNLYIPGLRARTKSKSSLSNHYFLADCNILGKQYAAIVYHGGLEPNAPYLFYDWFEFYLPKRVPHCCCRAQFYKVWLPYVNKVYESIKIKFPEYGKYHQDDSVSDHYCTGPKCLNVMPEDLK